MPLLWGLTLGHFGLVFDDFGLLWIDFGSLWVSLQRLWVDLKCTKNRILIPKDTNQTQTNQNLFVREDIKEMMSKNSIKNFVSHNYTLKYGNKRRNYNYY